MEQKARTYARDTQRHGNKRHGKNLGVPWMCGAREAAHKEHPHVEYGDAIHIAQRGTGIPWESAGA